MGYIPPDSVFLQPYMQIRILTRMVYGTRKIVSVVTDIIHFMRKINVEK